MMRFILHLFSYLFHLALAVFLAGIAAVALIADAPNFELDMLPGSGGTLVNYLFFGNLAGILAIALAATGKFRYLYPLYGLAVFVLTVRGFFFTPYTYEGWSQFKDVLWFTLATLIALVGSVSQARAAGRKRY